MKNSNFKYPCLIAALYFGINVQGQATKNDSLKEQQIEEVVMIGYGKAKKVDLTSAIATVKPEELQKTPTSQVAQALQGKVAGVNVSSYGAPGDSPQINIRGIQTVRGETAPLYVVDGAFVDNIDFLNPSDIEDFQVLKDASASAIYGVKAAHGVVLITTKGGKFNRKATLKYNGYYGVQRASNVPTMANTQQFTNFELESGSAFRIAAIDEAINRFGRSRVDPNIPAVNTDWYKETLRMAMIQSHEISVDGGTKDVAYSIGGDFLDQDGILRMKNSYERFNFRAKVDAKAKDWLTVGASAVYSKSVKYDQESSVWRQIYYAVPVFPKYDELFTDADPLPYGDAYVLGYRGHQNPFALMDNSDRRGDRRRVLLNIYADFEILPKHLNFKTSFSYNNKQTLERIVNLPYYVNDNFQRTIDESFIQRNSYENENYYWDNTLTYNNKFGNHDVTAMVGTSYRDEYYNKFWAKGYFYDGGAFVRNLEQSWYLTNTVEDTREAGDEGTHYYGLSYFGRLQYKYKNKYILYATDRIEGSNKYNDQKYINLPAFGAAWVLSEENFMKDISKINLLKLRFGWGRLADESVAAAQLATASTAETVFNDQLLSGYVFSTNSDHISYEYTEELNFGLSAEFFRRKLSLEADYYIKDSKELVIPVSPILGSEVSYNNVGAMRNKGLELALTWRDNISDNFGFSISTNASFMSNEMTSLGGQPYFDTGSAEFRQRYQVGQPFLSFYGYDIIGVYQNDAEVAADPTGVAGGAVPGYFKYRDINGDGVIDGDDRMFLGSPLPTYNFGATLGLNYKQWDFSVSVYGQGGNVILDRNRAEVIWTQGLNIDADLAVNRWHGEGTTNAYPSAEGYSAGWNQKMSKFWLVKGDFVRIQNIQLGYTLKQDKLPEMRFTLTADRPFTWANSYNKFNLETPANGINQDLYPTPSTFTFGWNVKF